MRRLWIGFASFAVLCAMVVFSVELVVFDNGFYVREYTKLDTEEVTGVKLDDLLDATKQLLLYVQDKRDDLTMRYEVSGYERQLFNQREIDHMEDVRNLYLGARNVRRLGTLVLAGLIAYILWGKKRRKDRFTYVCQGMIDAMIILGCIVIFLTSFYIIDFERFWTAFHLFFFTNDLWLLDPRTDIMIQMVPLEFFMDCVGRIILYVGIQLAAIAIVSIWRVRSQAKQLA